MKLVSVIIPTYNRQKYLKNAINSVLNQTYENIELIIIDDNSNDNTQSYVENINDNRLIYIKNSKNLKAPKSRNIGIEKSRGDYIAFLDDDDTWHKTKLEKQIRLFDNKKVGLVYSAIELFFEDLNFSYTSNPQKRGYIYKDILINNYIGATPSVLIRKEALSSIKDNKNDFFDSNFPARQDYDLWIRVCKKWDVDFINIPTVKQNYRSNMNRISTNLYNHIEAHTLMNSKYSFEINQHLSKELKSQRITNQYLFLAAQAIKIYNTKLSRKFYLKAFNHSRSLKILIMYFATFFGPKFILKLRSYK